MGFDELTDSDLFAIANRFRKLGQSGVKGKPNEAWFPGDFGIHNVEPESMSPFSTFKVEQPKKLFHSTLKGFVFEKDLPVIGFRLSDT